MRNLVTFAALAVVLTGIAAGPAEAVRDKTKIPKICAQAEERYQKIFGKPSADETFTVVKMYKYTFCPVEITVSKGTTVRWVNVDKRTSHDVWFKERGKEPWDRLFPDEHAETVFEIAGEFPYLCKPHWESDDMHGKVTVTE